MMTQHDKTALQGSENRREKGMHVSGSRGAFVLSSIGVRAVCVLIVAMTLAIAAAGCKSDDGPDRRMAESSGEFTKGYEDGRRDASNSWTDLHGGWMWLWMTDQQYQEGYNRGWDDGRSEKKLRDKQQSQDAEQSKSKGLFGSDDES